MLCKRTTMKKPTTITATEYRRLTETANKRRAGTKGHPEHDLQVACVAWFRTAFPVDASMLFAVPNGGRRGKVEAAILKAEGVTAGVADLILLEARGSYGALCIEMKTRRRDSGQSDKQKEWQLEAERHGNKYVVCRDFASFCREVMEYKRLPRTTAGMFVRVTAADLNASGIAPKSAKDAKF